MNFNRFFSSKRPAIKLVAHSPYQRNFKLLSKHTHIEWENSHISRIFTIWYSQHWFHFIALWSPIHLFFIIQKNEIWLFFSHPNSVPAPYFIWINIRTVKIFRFEQQKAKKKWLFFLSLSFSTEPKMDNHAKDDDVCRQTAARSQHDAKIAKVFDASIHSTFGLIHFYVIQYR